MRGGVFWWLGRAFNSSRRACVEAACRQTFLGTPSSHKHAVSEPVHAESELVHAVSELVHAESGVRGR